MTNEGKGVCYLPNSLIARCHSGDLQHVARKSSSLQHLLHLCFLGRSVALQYLLLQPLQTPAWLGGHTSKPSWLCLESLISDCVLRALIVRDCVP